MKALHLLLLLLICPNAMGDGLAAYKSQTYHDDADASIIYYRKLIDRGQNVIQIITKDKELNLDRGKIAGYVDIITSFNS